MNIGKSKVVVFGGLVDKRFLDDIFVYDIGTFLYFSTFLSIFATFGLPSSRCLIVLISCLWVKLIFLNLTAVRLLKISILPCCQL